MSLAFLQFRVLGVRSSKGYQADDWMRRPLPKAQLEYAATDIEHLPALQQALRQRARELGREHVIGDACRELLLPEPAGAPLLTFESFRNAWQLDAAGQNALRALIDMIRVSSSAQASKRPALANPFAGHRQAPEPAEDH